MVTCVNQLGTGLQGKIFISFIELKNVSAFLVFDMKILPVQVTVPIEFKLETNSRLNVFMAT